MHELVRIDFKMNIDNEGQQYVIQFNESGKLYLKNQKTYLLFKEPSMENQDFNDLTLICDKDEMVIIRYGFVNMKQNYRLNQFTTGLYKNKFITSNITTFTKEYNFTKDNIYLNYDIILNDEIIGNYKMDIDIKRSR